MTTTQEENECGPDQDLQLQTIDLCREAPGYSRIEKLRAIVEAKSFMEIEGVPVDMQSANVVVQVYDRLNEANRAALMNRPTITSVIDVAWRVVARSSKRSK